MRSSVKADPEKDNVRCARGDAGYWRRLRFSAKLDLLDTDGLGLSDKESLGRGVGIGVVDVDETAEVLMDCGRMMGERRVRDGDEPVRGEVKGEGGGR